MAASGGAVYLLSSYQSGRQRRRCRSGGGAWERYTEEDESHDKREHLVPEEKSTFASLPPAVSFPPFRELEFCSRFLKWKMSDETRLRERLSACRGMTQADNLIIRNLCCL